ncbi:MAG: hypothetical protein MJ252_07610 [archaeon]|nr:hypothetical protein [archaeon]
MLKNNSFKHFLLFSLFLYTTTICSELDYRRERSIYKKYNTDEQIDYYEEEYNYTEEEYELNCTTPEQKYSPRCIFPYEIELDENKDPMLSKRDKLWAFMNLPTFEKKKERIIYLFDNYILNETNITENLINRILLNMCFMKMNCSVLNDDEFYNCRTVKNYFLGLTIEYLKQLNDLSYEELFNLSSYTEKSNRGYAYFKLISNISLCSDGMDLFNAGEYFILLKKSVGRFEEMRKVFNQIATEDFIFYLGIGLDSFINSFNFIEIENEDVRAYIDNKTNFMAYPLFIDTVELFEEYLKESSVYYYMLDFINIKINIKDLVYDSNERRLSEGKFSYLPTIEIHYSSKVLIEKIGCKQLSYIRYKKYPLYSFKYRLTNFASDTISIKMMDSKGKFLEVSGLQGEAKFRIYFTVDKDKEKYCYYRQNGYNYFKTEGVETDLSKIKNGWLICYSSHLTEFTYGDKSIGGIVYTSNPNRWCISVFITSIVIFSLVFIFIIFRIIYDRNNKSEEKTKEISLASKNFLFNDDSSPQIRNLIS